MSDFYMFEQNDSWICPRWYNLKKNELGKEIKKSEINNKINWLKKCLCH